MEAGKNNQPEPKDTYKIAYIIHFLLGSGNLLPWNTLITAVDYFSFLYPKKHVEKVFSVAYMSSSMFILVFMMSYSGWREKLSFRVRMNLGFFMFVLSLMVTPVLDWTQFGYGPGSAYGLVVASVVVCGLADGLIFGSLIGSAGKLPKEYMQAVFAGTASSGVLVSVLRIITKASLPRTPQGLRTSAYSYFLLSTIILIGCIVCCNLLYKLPVMQHHYKSLQNHTTTNNSLPKFWDVANQIRLPFLGIFMIYAVTLSIFPGFLAENIKSKILKDWYPLLLITTYNVADFLGKSLTAIYVVKDFRKATWASLSRLLFYPMFTACLHGPKWLRSEVPVVVLTFMLGLTNGYLTSVLMILGPKLVTRFEAEIAAVVMAVFLGLGLVAGSVLGWVWII